jgi:hypothetical protein
MCGTQFVADQTPTTSQTAGDCHKKVCDGAGNITTIVDDNDPPDDGLECTVDTCSNGSPVHTPKQSGTACGTGSVCDATGQCVGCVQNSDCGTDTACKKFTCTSGTCSSTNVTAGTVVSNANAGDCKSDQCDGNGGITTNAPDANDLPVDNKQCTSDVCNNGVASNPPVAQGTSCTQNGGTKCDSAGNCVQCFAAGDCGTDTACKKFTCTAGVCGSTNVTAGTVVNNPVAGDCHSDQCDGSGNITTNAVDNNDKPADDGKQCTTDTCNAGTPVHPPVAQGTACTQNGGTKCDASGNCVQCFQASDCGANTACKSFTCDLGVCNQHNVTLGTVVNNPVTGDCRSDQCDGNGNVTAGAVDNTDVPADDGKQCTTDTCSAGTPVHTPVAQGTSCTQNGGTKCDSAGNCVQCFQASDCGTDTACKTFTCNAGVCGSNNVAAGTVVNNAVAGDCHSDQCDGNGNITTNAVDNNDKPADDGNQCTLDNCNAGTPQHPPAPQGTSCNQNGGTVCNGAGVCGTCTQDADCPSGGACQVPKCNAGTCGFAAASAQVLPAALQTAGDCQVLTCDGASQTPVSVADNIDVPPSDGNECTTDTCSNGAPVHPPVAVDTVCTGGFCNATGTCVQCTQNAQCPSGNACQIPTCTGGTCGFTGVAAGTVVGNPTAGDCKSNQCDGNGNITVGAADDTDVPNDNNACTTDSCSGGSPVFTPVTAGASCGGTSLCDGKGNCQPSPQVSLTTPSDGGTALATTTIAVSFTYAMTPATLTAQTAAGACTGSIQVSLNDFATCIAFTSASPSMNGSNTVATLTPQPGLLVNRTYKIRVTTAATSTLGQALASQYTSTTGFTAADPHAIVISQVYGGGGNNGATYKNDFIELHNRGAVPINLAGWSVQYTSASGTSFSNSTALSGTIQPGAYFLIQEAAGTGGTTALPAPDLPGTIGLGSTGGKVALLTTTTLLTTGCPTASSTPALVDFVWYGGGSGTCSEGATTAATANGTSAIRKQNGCQDTNVNSADFTIATVTPTGVNIPRNSATTAVQCAPTQNEAGAALEADYCDTQFPLSLNVTAGQSTGNVYGRIYESGVTGMGSASASITAQLGYGPITANPEYDASWTWVGATYNATCSGCGNNDEYQASFTAPATAGSYGYVYRFSLDGGVTWTYCDNNQADAGAGSNANLTFDLENIAVLTVP